MSVKKWKLYIIKIIKKFDIKIDKQINFNFTYINPALRLETLPFIFSLDHPFLSSSPLSLLSAHMCYNIFISYQKLFLTSSFWQSQRVVVRHRVSWKLFFTSWSTTFFLDHLSTTFEKILCPICFIYRSCCGIT